MAIYYVSSSGGNDSNSGTSTGSPWKTLNQARGAMSSGDTVYLKKGDTWREAASIVDANVTWDAYGSGDKPLIMGSNSITGWAHHSGSVYSAYCSTAPNIVFIDGNEGRKRSSSGNCISEYDWYYSSNILYLNASGDPDTEYTTLGVEAEDRSYCIFTDGYDNLTIKNIQFWGAENGIDLTRSDNSRIESCLAAYNFKAGIKSFASNDMYIGYNTCYENGELGIRHTANTYSGSNVGGNDATIEWNVCYDNGSWTYAEWYQSSIPGQWAVYTGNIKLWGRKTEVNRCVVQHNICYNAGPFGGEGNGGDWLNGTRDWDEIAGCGIGIWIDETGDHNVVRYNTVYDSNSSGIDVEQTDYTQTYMNVCYANAIGADYTGQIRVRRYPQHNKTYNNICLGPGYAGIAAEHTQAYNGDYNYNIFKNNICYGNTFEFFACRGAMNAHKTTGDNHDGTGNVWDYNLFGPQRASFCRVGSTTGWADTLSTYADVEASKRYNGSTHSIPYVPTFVSTAASNFRPLTDSPQVNAGVDVGLAVDFDQIVLPQGGVYDVGAFEYTEDAGVPSATAAIGFVVTDFALPEFTVQQYSEGGEFLDKVVIGDGSGDYLTVSAWNAARGGLNVGETCVTQQVKPRAIFRSVGTSDTIRATMTKADWGDTSAAYHPVIYTEPAYRYGIGVPTTGSFSRMETSDQCSIRSEVNHLEIIGLHAVNTAQDAYDSPIVLVSCEGVKVVESVFTVDANGQNDCRGVAEKNCSVGSNYIRNNLIYGITGDTGQGGAVFSETRSGGTLLVHNTGVIDSDVAFRETSGVGTFEANMCYAFGGTADFAGSWQGTSNGYVNSPMGSGSINLSTSSAAAIFRNYTGGDFRVKDNASPLAGGGPTLYGHATLPVTVDLEGGVRPSSGNASVGPYEQSGITVGLSLPTLSFDALLTGQSTSTGQTAFVLDRPSFGIMTHDADEAVIVGLSLPRPKYLVPTSEAELIAGYRAGRKPSVDVLKWWWQ